MKLTIILLTAAFLNVSASGISQTVTFSGENVSLKQVFTAVEKQTGYVFFYDEAMLEQAKLVSVRATDETLQIFLDKVLKDQRLFYRIKDKAVIIAAAAPNLRFAADEILAPPGSVQGRVINEEGVPLAAANIKVNGTNLGTSTDENGYYKISTIAVGEYTLVVSFIGYSTSTTIIKITESGTTTFDFTLRRSLVNLDEMTVTSTLSAKKIRSYPATIAVINQADLKNRNINNIANVLEAVPGIIITPGSEAYNSGNTRQPSSLLIRGTSAGAPIKYLVDGIEIVSADYGLSILQTLDPNSIEKIEVLKGPMASTLYGNGAAGGIISITTKKGKSGKTKVNFKTMFTQYANDYADYNGYNQNYSLNVSGGNEQFNYLLGAAYNLYPLTKLTDINNGIDTKTWSYNARIGGKVNNIAADLSLQYGNEKSGSGSTIISQNKFWESLGIAPQTVSPLEDYRFSQRNFLTTLHLTHTITNNFYQDLTLGYNIMNYSVADYTINSGVYYNAENLYTKVNARYFMFYDHSWSDALKTNITAGFEYNNYETHYLNMGATAPLTNFFTVYTPATQNAASYNKSPYSSTGYFAEAVTGFRNNLFLTTGIRYDVNPAYGDKVKGYAQPRVGLSYVIESAAFKIKPRIVWGVSSLAPDPTYKVSRIDNSSPYSIRVYTGNTNIKPQRSEGYEFGADVFYGGNYSLNVTYYDQRIKDMIQRSFSYDFTTNPLTINFYYDNIASAINRGLEISAKAVVDPFTVDVSYTQTTSKWDVPGLATSAIIYPNAPNLGIPQKSLFARLTYKIPSLLPWTKKGGNISLDWRYNGSAYNVDNIRYTLAYDAWVASNYILPYPDQDNYYSWQKGYSYFNLRADYSITNYAALYVDIQNLLDKQGSANGESFLQFPGRRINFGFNINF